ncbi:MAG: sensor histidine kinase N-terminal domain-containing protein [Betaproteobacteria bacterium]|nr:sensor histidine kinase N-terminal domain-containing protein [Betaproteobacteria bacterium]
MSRRTSLYQLLLRWLLGPLIVILLAGSVLAYLFSLRAAMNVYDLGLLDDALDLSKQVVVRDGEMQLALPPAALQMLQENNDDRVTYAAWDDRGHVFSGNPRLFASEGLPAEDGHQFRDLTLNGEENRAIVMKGKVGRTPFFIAVAQTLHGRDRLRDGIFASILLPEALLALVSVAVILFGVRFALAPVKLLRNEIVSRSSADLRPIGEAGAPAELFPVVHGINELLANLADSFASHRRFIADAAHQLRTPLASLSSQIEVALEKPPSDVRALLRELLATTNRTTHLANQLLSLARLEHTESSMLEVAAVSLERVCREASADFVTQAARKGVDLEFVLEPCQVRGSPLMLRELLANLLDNAIRYTPSGGQVGVGLKKGQDGVVLTVEDNGPGVAEAEWPNLGTPFHRLASDFPEGCGLGLAIVREIARLHEAELAFGRSAAGHGLKVSVYFKI